MISHPLYLLYITLPRTSFFSLSTVAAIESRSQLMTSLYFARRMYRCILALVYHSCLTVR